METECKIFVGNVPFQCNQLEFNECFEKMPGFIKAEIVCKNDGSLSRGFGFVTFDTKENAEKLMENTNITFKDRILRFTEYTQHTPYGQYIEKSQKEFNECNSQDEYLQPVTQQTQQISKKNIDIKQKNLLLVKNLKLGMTREQLYDIFSEFGQIGRHFIVTDQDTGNQKSYAVVEILNDSVYELLVKQKEVESKDNCIFEISKWKTRQQSQPLYQFQQSHQAGVKNIQTNKKLFYGNGLFN